MKLGQAELEAKTGTVLGNIKETERRVTRAGEIGPPDTSLVCVPLSLTPPSSHAGGVHRCGSPHASLQAPYPSQSPRQ